MPLWQRTYRCGNCGLVMDRDENSAVNQLRRFAFPAWATHGRSRAVCGCIHHN
jgi:transposase